MDLVLLSSLKTVANSEAFFPLRQAHERSADLFFLTWPSSSPTVLLQHHSTARNTPLAGYNEMRVYPITQELALAEASKKYVFIPYFNSVALIVFHVGRRGKFQPLPIRQLHKAALFFR
ncbi:MAG TPA: hypothetical protein VMV34_00570 [Terriglobia bacterium]|nr:hypothetical protein [Terriglobia bacterium]